MNSTLFFYINLLLGAIIIALGIYIVWALKKIQSLRVSVRDGAQSSNLEDVLHATANKIKHLESTDLALKQHLQQIETFVQKNIRGVGVHKFNAFPDEGGNLSFTIALLDNTKTGFVVSSIHGRTNNRLYIKTVDKGASQSELTEEEKLAIQQAAQQVISV